MSAENLRPLIGIPAATSDPSPVPRTPFSHFNAFYPDALMAAGALPVVIPLNLAEADLRALFERLDGVLLAGGVDVDPTAYGELRHSRLGKVDPARDRAELTLARWALATGLPLLGICRGVQALNVAAGGNLYQDLSSQYPGAVRHDFKHKETPWDMPAHEVRVAAGSRLSAILDATALTTNSFHHQAVRQTAPSLRPVAWAEDGVIEGIEEPAHRFAIGVQWHPEAVVRSDPFAMRLFAAFVAAAASSSSSEEM